MDNVVMPVWFARTLRLKVKTNGYKWLNAAAIEVNQVWNWCNATSVDAADRNRRVQARFLNGFDLCNLSAGASEYFDHIGADSIQRVCCEYAGKLRAARKIALERLKTRGLTAAERAKVRMRVARLLRGKLRWRASMGAKRALGWVPFKALSVKRTRTGVRFCGKNLRLFERERLEGVKWRDGCFAQDAVGDWWLCLPVSVEAKVTAAAREEVGIDLGVMNLAVTSDGERLAAGRWTVRYADKLAQAQRRGHKQAAKRLHRKIGRSRANALHQFSRSIVNRYERIYVGDVNPSQLARTRMAKAVLDCGWSTLRTQLQYKGQQAGRSIEIVNERNTTRACSGCGALTGPAGPDMLVVRQWVCDACGEAHDRDVNAARNILNAGSRSLTSVRGNQSSLPSARRAGHHRPHETKNSVKAVAA